MKILKRSLLPVVCAVFALALGACSQKQEPSEEQLAMLKMFLAERETTKKYLETFDELDFVIYSNQEWTRLHESHAQDVLVFYPDGSTTRGLVDHIAELKKTFVYAPDTRIEEHPISIGSGKYTAVTGYMIGTFTEPMPLDDGTFIQPTNKKFKVGTATFGVWEDGVMKEEHLFWDNQSFMKQIGVTK
jgi:hypothetical protein